MGFSSRFAFIHPFSPLTSLETHISSITIINLSITSLHNNLIPLANLERLVLLLQYQYSLWAFVRFVLSIFIILIKLGAIMGVYCSVSSWRRLSQGKLRSRMGKRGVCAVRFGHGRGTKGGYELWMTILLIDDLIVGKLRNASIIDCTIWHLYRILIKRM